MNTGSRTFIIVILLASGAFGFLTSLLGRHVLQQSNTENGAQIVQVVHHPVTFVAQIKGDPRAGEKVFKEFCTSCHGAEPAINVNAPRIDDKKTWELRRKRGINALLQVTITGVGAMPARGGCFECSDEQLRQAIEYMLK